MEGVWGETFSGRLGDYMVNRMARSKKMMGGSRQTGALSCMRSCDRRPSMSTVIFEWSYCIGD